MAQLNQRDVRALLDFLRKVYSARDAESYIGSILSGLPQVVPSDMTSFHQMQPLLALSRNWTNPPEINTRQRDLAWQRVMHQHPVLQRYMQTGDGRPCKISDFLTRTEFHRLALYAEFYRAMDVEDDMPTTITAAGGTVVATTVHRRKRNFVERDRLLLDLVRPHLAQAWQSVQLLNHKEQEARAGWRLLEHVGHGVVRLSPDGRVLMMTERARACVEEYLGPRAVLSDRLPESWRRWVVRQKALLRGNRVPAPRTALTEERGQHRLVIQLISDDHEDVLVLSEQRMKLPVAAVRGLGISPREAEVLTWLAQGKSDIEISTILAISARTVQKHLEHIFQKLGVENRTAAALAFTRLLQDVAA